MDYKKILVPDVLPNNLRAIRDMRGLALKTVADALKIDRNFLSAVEVQSRNFSGKTTIRAMQYFGITFYKLYDVKKIVTTDVTDYTENEFNITLSFSVEDFFNEIEIKVDFNDINDFLDQTFVEQKELLNNHPMIIDAINERASEKVAGFLQDYKIEKYFYNANTKNLLLELEVVFQEQYTISADIDINLVKNEDTELTNHLAEYGFPDTIRSVERFIDGEKVKLEGKYLHFHEPFRFSVDGTLENFKEKDKININEGNVSIRYEDGVPVYARFKCIHKDINNLKYIRSLKEISIEEMYKALGFTYNGYINLELGNQKVSTKIMWRMVKKLRVPLELIINIDEYFETLSDKKIEKKQNRGSANDVDE